MKMMKTEDAVGHVLCHDITQIIPGVVKDAVFRKGHVVTKDDIPVLLSVGKEHLYVWEKQEGMLHEDEAAEILRSVCQNAQMDASKPKEGKIELKSAIEGVFLVDSARLFAVNSIDELMIATRRGGVLHGLVVDLGEHEADTDGFDAALHLDWLEIEVDAGGLQQGAEDVLRPAVDLVAMAWPVDQLVRIVHGLHKTDDGARPVAVQFGPVTVSVEWRRPLALAVGAHRLADSVGLGRALAHTDSDTHTDSDANPDTHAHRDEDLGPAFPSEASGMDDVPF